MKRSFIKRSYMGVVTMLSSDCSSICRDWTVLRKVDVSDLDV